jgi:uncharacterized protein
MSGKPQIEIPKERIAEFCRRHHIRKLSLFGSVLREDFGPDSDIDVLVEFEPGQAPGFAFFGMQEELSQILSRRVDLNTPNFLSRYFRNQVLGQAEVQYACWRLLAKLPKTFQRICDGRHPKSLGSRSQVLAIGWFTVTSMWIWTSFGLSSAATCQC